MQPPSRHTRSILGSISVAAIVAIGASSPAAARPPEGGYFAFGVGYAASSGDRGVPLKSPNSKGAQLLIDQNSAAYKEEVRSGYGSGMSLELSFGWLIGPVAPEITFFGHGTFDTKNGAALPMFQLHFHPFMLVDAMADSKIDANVYLGAGYVIGGYHPKDDPDGKGWEGWVFDVGVGASYELSKGVNLGLDVKFALPMYSSWIFSNSHDIAFEPVSTPSTLIIAPSLRLQVFF